MSIEFRCTGCDQLMRTTDDTAGKHAKCPACSATFTIPAVQGILTPTKIRSADRQSNLNKHKSWWKKVSDFLSEWRFADRSTESIKRAVGNEWDNNDEGVNIVLCPACSGQGYVAGRPEDTCRNCQGRGIWFSK